ncbi:MAG TPA: hypothetical protein VKG45_11915 [Actinomycetes bacterium]|nr:hypothetical protein [Actinomycetes bacterium]
MARPTIASSAARLLTEHGPLASGELGRLLAAAGVVRARDPVRSVAQALGPDARFTRLDDDRWAWLPAVLEGAVLTHRLSADEAETEAVRLEPDLAPLAPLAIAGLALVAGGSLRRLADDWQRAAGPAGWLGEAPAGTLLGFRLRDGRLELGTLPEAGVGSRLAARRLAAAARARLAGLEPLFEQPVTPVWRLVVEALAELPMLLFEPVDPLGELLDAAGLEVRGGLVGHHGTDWSSWEPGTGQHAGGPPGEETELDQARRRHPGAGERGRHPAGRRSGHPAEELDEVGAEALAIAVGAFALFTQEGQVPSGADAEGLARVLSYPRVAEALAAEAGRDPSLEQFLEPVAVAAGGGRAAAAPCFLLAVCAEARGERGLAEERIAQALKADPSFAPALLRAARYAGERGDTDAVLALLDRAGIELEPAERRQLARFGHNGRGSRPPRP